MEDLTKTQLVLLTLLVSFVTSIGTGIITVSLLQQAPQNVTQTINRVVERTVEKVVPSDEKDNVPSVTREVTTVVVKEEDLVIDAISANSKSLVRIRKEGSSGSFYGLGMILTTDGWIVAGDNAMSKGVYTVKLADGKEFKADMVEASNALGLTYLKIRKDDSDLTVFTGAPRGNANNLQLGQTVIDLGGATKDIVSIGRVVSVDYQGNASSTTSRVAEVIDTDIVPKNAELGSVLINLNGEAVGFKIGMPVGTVAHYVPINLILARLATVQAAQ